jgi:hypothetical protein
VTLELAAQVRRHAAARSWGLEESAARLRIQTIDAFNAYLANAMPITSRTGFGRGIADAPEDLYANAQRETLRDAETDPELRGSFELILRRLDDNWSLLERLIAGMLSRRAEWLPNLPQLSGEALVPKIEDSLRTIVLEELAASDPRAAAGFRGAGLRGRAHFAATPGRELPGATCRAGKTTRARWPSTSRTCRAGARCGTCRSPRKASRVCGSPARKVFPPTIPTRGHWGGHSPKGWPTRTAPHPRARGHRHPARAGDSRVGARRPRRAGETAGHGGGAADTHLRRAGRMRHPEVAGAARRALTEDSVPTPLAERLGTRISHILVDEFQDTSRDQYELLLTLTQDWSEGDGRTLFLVGDPMQSIYGFRNAEVGRFATVRDGGLGRVRLHPLELRRNFRSAPALVHWCNEMFARVFPATDDVRRSAVRHLASVAARSELEGRPSLYRVDADCGPRGEAESAAELIAELRRSRPEESIAVLGGARTHLRAIRAALAARAVPFIGREPGTPRRRGRGA